MSRQGEFFSQKNEGMLQRVLYSDICRRLGTDLSEKQATRLMKTVKHYMGEVYRVKGENANMSVLNKDVLHVVLPDYLMYMERSATRSSREADIEAIPDTVPVVAGVLEDVGTAFSQLQANRQNANKPRAPEMQDFRISLQDEPPISLDTFERIKNDRDADRVRAEQGQQNFAQANDHFVHSRRRAEEVAEAAFAEREREQLEARAAAAEAAQSKLPMPPDMRALYVGDQPLERTMNRLSDAPNVSTRQQMIITREPESMEYKENELNLFIYSGDRDWISNSSETRYSFSVSFDPGNMPTGLRLSPTSTVKFRNIVRIEFVKAIMPGESVDSLVTRTHASSAFSYSAPYNFNVLSFPYIQVRIPELDTNTYGTNQGLNSAFGILQYDANWIYDTSNENARGYFAMIPKFMKCQKVYSPTPLATIQKLTFRMERPDGTLVSSTPDTLDINHIYTSKEIAGTDAFPYGYDSALENGTSAAYYFLKTSTFFNQLTVSKGDRIVIKNLNWSVAPSGAAIAQIQDFLTYIQQDAGLLVVDIGYTAAGGAFSTIAVGSNKQAYCNYIVVRGKFTDPTLGGTVTSTLGLAADSSTPGSLTGISAFLSGNDTSSGRLLNQSHQVQIALRVITREMDSTSILRPDNL